MPKKQISQKNFSSVEELRNAIVERYPDLSKRLQQVGRYVIDRQNDFAIETVATIADRSGVHASAVVRFAKEFGFDGANSMQRLFREKLIAERNVSDYKTRIRTASKSSDVGNDQEKPPISEQLVMASIDSMQRLANSDVDEFVRRVAEAISSAESVYIAGWRRSSAIAMYLAYALGRARKKNLLIDGRGGFHFDQIGQSDNSDLLIVTSFYPYAEESIAVAKHAKTNNTPIALISDSELSPIGSISDFKVLVQDPEVMGFRSLSSTFCIAQAVVIEYLSVSADRKQ